MPALGFKSMKIYLLSYTCIHGSDEEGGFQSLPSSILPTGYISSRPKTLSWVPVHNIWDLSIATLLQQRRLRWITGRPEMGAAYSKRLEGFHKEFM